MIVASNSLTLSNVNDGTIVHIAYANSADGKNWFYVSGGGTNLLTGTGNHTVTGTGSNAHGYLSNETTDDLLSLFKGLEGQTVTVSVDYEYSGFIAGSGSNRIGWEIGLYGDTTVWLGPWYSPTNSSGSGRASHTVVVPKNITSIAEGYGYIEFSGSGTGTVSHLKLEKGDVATPWCPAPSEAHPTYMGTYADFTQEASSDPTKYQWSKIKGDDGKDGLGIKSTIITYQLSSSGTTTPTGTWSTTVPTLVKGQYLWTRTTLVYTDNTTKDVYTVSYVAKDGNNGTDGVAGKDGVGIKSTTIAYQASTSGTTAPTGTWVANPPSVTDGNYLWTRTVWNYTDGTSETGYSVAKAGEKGDKGDQGIPGPAGADGKTSYLHIAYANSADGSGCTTKPDINSSYKYIGTYTDYTSTSSTNPSSYTWAPMFDSTKKRNFTTTPTTPYAVGDTWTQSGFTKFCIKAKNSGAFDANDWTVQQLTIQSLDSNIQTDLNNSVKTTRNYKGVTLNDAGLTATAGDTTVAMNSNAGFLINNLKHDSADNPGGQVFHVDTDGNLTISGNLTAGNSPTATISGVNFTGQNLTLSGSLKLTGDTSAIASNGGDVVFNKDGIIATSGPITVNINGTNPLRIQSNNNDIFRVDNDGNVSIKGDLSAGDSPNSTISGVNFTGDNLTLTGSLKLIPASDGTNGVISFAGGHGILGENGISLQAVKDGNILSISNQAGEQTTYIRNDGTLFASGGEFSGTISGSKIILKDDDGSVINANNGVFEVNSKGDVTAKSLTLTGNGLGNGKNSASLSGVNIYNGSIIEGSQIIGNAITGSRFLSAKRESAMDTYYPISNSVYTPSFFVNDDGTINVHTTFPRSFSLATGIDKSSDSETNVGPVFKVNEAFDRSTLAGSIGYGKGYDYPIPYLYGQQAGMPSYPVDTDELSIVWLNDVTKDILLKQSYCDNYRYTQIASVSGITSDYASKTGRIKINFGIVDSYGSYDVNADSSSAGGVHDLILVLTTGPINESDLYHIDPQMAYFNNMNNDIKIKMVSKKILSGATGHSYYNLYGELSTQDLGPADTYYLGVLQQGFVKSEKADSDRTWKIQIDNLDVVPDSTIESDQSYFTPRVGGSYRELAISPNGSIITQMSRGLVNDTSEYNADYITFSSSVTNHMPFWTTVNSDGIGFSIGDDSASQDGKGNNNGLFTRQCIYFSGSNNTNGISFDNYGNIHPQQNSSAWRIYDKSGNSQVDFNTDSNPITFNKRVSLHTGGESDITTTWVAASSLYNGAHLPAIGRSDWWNRGAQSGMIAIANGNMYYFSGLKYWNFNWGTSGNTGSWGTGSD